MSALRLIGKKRLSFEIVMKYFLEIFPQFVETPERTTILKFLLNQLQAEGWLEFPSARNKDAWYQDSNSNCPRWITLVIEDVSSSESLQKIIAETIWVKELHFAPELRLRRQIEMAARINEFLKCRRNDMMMVPLRERAVEIFGDEKKLDSLVRKSTLFNGRLPLSLIGAFEVDPPLSFTQFESKSQVILILENYHSYWSFCEWNHRTLEYRAIIYGAGNAILRSNYSLSRILSQTNASVVEYLGDLDEAGLRIAIELFNSHYSEFRYFFPASRFYKWLLEKGNKRETAARAKAPSGLHSFFGEETTSLILDLIDEGKWIPQESLGLEALTKYFSSGADAR
jgi:hypothetical protein